MRSRLILLAAAVTVLLVAPAATAVQTKDVAVSITKVGFVPKTATIETSDSVTWTNNDTVNHQVVSQGAGLASPILKPNEKYSFTFTKAGRFTIIDALDSKFPKATVVVTAPSGVTLNASPQVITYGGATALSGKVASGEAGLKVAVSNQPCNERTAKQLSTLTTDSTGAFSMTDHPAKQTAFVATAKGAASSAVTVQVRPKLSLARIGRHLYRVRLTAGDSFVGRAVVFRRFSALSERWVTVRRVVLRTATPSSLPMAGTMISSATFRSNIKHRLRVRVVLPAAQAGACYLAANSRTIRS